MLHVRYKSVPNEKCRMENISLERDYNIMEYVRTTKESLNRLMVRNIASDFCDDVQGGDFDHLNDEDYNAILHTVKHLCKLWKYLDDPLYDEKEAQQAKMSVPMLLTNAINELMVLNALLWDSGYYRYLEHEEQEKKEKEKKTA